MRPLAAGQLRVRGRWRFALGVALVLHALAHALAGIWASQPEGAWAAAVLWWLATAGFMLAGAWLLALLPRQNSWSIAAVVASMGSLGLIVLVHHPAVLPGAVVSLLVAVVALVSAPVVELHRPHRRAAGAAALAFALGTTYISAAILLRPWYMQWGTTDADFAQAVPGDDRAAAARYRADHAITIHAPAEAVWPWIAQLSQDGASLHSHDALDRTVGADVTGWGAFVLVPLDDSTARLIVRTRGDGRPMLRHTFTAPFGAFLVEPVHFIMQRKMLLTIKSNAERIRLSSEHARTPPVIRGSRSPALAPG
jgi:hypothetical protein